MPSTAEYERQIEQLLNRILQLEMLCEASGIDHQRAARLKPHDVRAPPPRHAIDCLPRYLLPATSESWQPQQTISGRP